MHEQPHLGRWPAGVSSAVCPVPRRPVHLAPLRRGCSFWNQSTRRDALLRKATFREHANFGPASAGPFLLERSRAPCIVLLRKPLFRQYPIYPLPFRPAFAVSFLVQPFLHSPWGSRI